MHYITNRREKQQKFIGFYLFSCLQSAYQPYYNCRKGTNLAKKNISTDIMAAPKDGALGQIWDDFRVDYFLKNADKFEKSDFLEICSADTSGNQIFGMPTEVSATILDPRAYRSKKINFSLCEQRPMRANPAVLRIDFENRVIELSSDEDKSEYDMIEIRWNLPNPAPKIRFVKSYRDEDSKEYDKQYVEKVFDRYKDGKVRLGDTYLLAIIGKYFPDVEATAKITFQTEIKNLEDLDNISEIRRNFPVVKITHPAGQMKSKIIEEVLAHYAKLAEQAGKAKPNLIKSAIKSIRGRLGGKSPAGLKKKQITGPEL